MSQFMWEWKQRAGDQQDIYQKGHLTGPGDTLKEVTEILLFSMNNTFLAEAP